MSGIKRQAHCIDRRPSLPIAWRNDFNPWPRRFESRSPSGESVANRFLPRAEPNGKPQLPFSVLVKRLEPNGWGRPQSLTTKSRQLRINIVECFPIS